MDFNIIHLNKVSSTQSYIIEQDKDSKMQEFTVFCTFNQTSGRGQGEHKWESEEGKNISFSFLVRPKFILPSEQFLLTQIASLSVADMLKKYIKEEVYVKWPNDIYVKNNKICGMLVQNKVIGNEFVGAYFGIGINVNQRKFFFAPNPTSMSIETNKEYDLDIILKEFLSCFQRRYVQLQQGKKEELKKEYMSSLLYKDMLKHYLYKGKGIEATIKDVDEYGYLILKTKEGNDLCCELKELTFIH
jgi:BirA family biotin operon repressor/biotin-[acetyl-CoA-carboxylase] ligase